MGLENVIIYLFMYAFLGWCCEVIYCSVGEGKFINRGMLNGPVCPIYGFGAVFVLVGLQDFPPTVTGIFVGGFIITSALEYFTSWAMEKAFNNHWWDYSKKRFNINGRVCLLNSTLFGLLCLVLYFDIHPVVSGIIEPLSDGMKVALTVILIVTFIADFSVTLKTILGVNYKIKIANEIKTTLAKEYEQFNGNEKIKELREKIEKHNISNINLDEKLGKKVILEGRLLKAFPQLRSKLLDEHVGEIVEKK